MKLIFSCFEGIRKICWGVESTLVLLGWGFGEYYQCGYWAALENRGSRLSAAPRGSNPLLSAGLRDPWDVKSHLSGGRFLTNLPADDTFRLVLKRGTVSVFEGGLIGRLSLLAYIPQGITRHA
jgi:hypothetical protein